MPPPSLFELVRVFVKISLLGFGGPTAHLALMLDEVVERRRWITRERFVQLVGVTNLLPGPNSSEVAIHIGYTQRGVSGALATGLSFLLPTFFIVLGLSWAYFTYGALPRVEGVLWGIKPAVLAVILWAGVKLARVAVTDATTAALLVLGVLVAFVAGGWSVLAMVVGGLVTWGRRRAAASLPPLVALLPALALPPLGTLATLFLTHLGIGSVLFGGGYMLIALLRPYAVDQHAWVTAAQLLDGVALTQAIPGPISTLVTFVGFGAAGVAGAVLATAGLYLPSFMAVLWAAPRVARMRADGPMAAALEGVSAVAAGAIVGVAIGLAPAAVPDVAGAVVFVAALVVLIRFGLAAGWVVLGGVVVGLGRVLLG